MVNKTIFSTIFLFCVFVSTIYGQNLTQIKEKYGQPIEAFSVSEQIWMTPEFTNDGQICMVRLYPKRISATTNYLNHKLNYWQLKDVLNQIAPPEKRGKKNPLSGITRIGGGSSHTIYGFKKITIIFVASYNSYFDPIDKDKPKAQKTEQEKVKQEKPQNGELEEEMLVPHDAEIVTITWHGRICS